METSPFHELIEYFQIQTDSKAPSENPFQVPKVPKSLRILSVSEGALFWCTQFLPSQFRIQTEELIFPKRTRYFLVDSSSQEYVSDLPLHQFTKFPPSSSNITEALDSEAFDDYFLFLKALTFTHLTHCERLAVWIPEVRPAHRFYFFEPSLLFRPSPSPSPSSGPYPFSTAPINSLQFNLFLTEFERNRAESRLQESRLPAHIPFKQQERWMIWHTRSLFKESKPFPTRNPLTSSCHTFDAFEWLSRFASPEILAEQQRNPTLLQNPCRRERVQNISQLLFQSTCLMDQHFDQLEALGSKWQAILHVLSQKKPPPKFLFGLTALPWIACGMLWTFLWVYRQEGCLSDKIPRLPFVMKECGSFLIVDSFQSSDWVYSTLQNLVSLARFQVASTSNYCDTFGLSVLPLFSRPLKASFLLPVPTSSPFLNVCYGLRSSKATTYWGHMLIARQEVWFVIVFPQERTDPFVLTNLTRDQTQTLLLQFFSNVPFENRSLNLLTWSEFADSIQAQPTYWLPKEMVFLNFQT